MPNINTVKKVKTKYTKAKFKKELPLHLMILPGLILVLIFSYVPMGGLIIAFQKFIPSKGMFGNQKWIGFDNFSYVFSLPGFYAGDDEYDYYSSMEDCAGISCSNRVCASFK